jgi:hypothetical protein
MSEHARENERNDVAPGSESPGPPADPTPDDVVAPVPQSSPGPPDVPADDDDEDRPTEEAEDKAIPGEYPEDNPDLEGEDRFDAG